MEEIFNKIVLGYKTNNENLMEANIKNWMSKDLPNPFEQNTLAHELYYKALMSYKRWAKKVINYRRSKVEMIEYVQQLMDLGVENPYTDKIKIEKNSEPDKKVIHVLGVLPEKEPEKEPEKQPESYEAEEDIPKKRPNKNPRKKGMLPVESKE